MPARSRAMAAAQRQLWYFTVQGTGPFPIDMLRYDRCWPASEGSDSVALAATFDLRGGGLPYEAPYNTRSVCLIGLDQPTEGRWASFGWKVL